MEFDNHHQLGRRSRVGWSSSSNKLTTRQPGMICSSSSGDQESMIMMRNDEGLRTFKTLKPNLPIRIVYPEKRLPREGPKPFSLFKHHHPLTLHESQESSYHSIKHLTKERVGQLDLIKVEREQEEDDDGYKNEVRSTTTIVDLRGSDDDHSELLEKEPLKKRHRLPASSFSDSSSTTTTNTNTSTSITTTTDPSSWIHTKEELETTLHHRNRKPKVYLTSRFSSSSSSLSIKDEAWKADPHRRVEHQPQSLQSVKSWMIDQESDNFQRIRNWLMTTHLTLPNPRSKIK